MSFSAAAEVSHASDEETVADSCSDTTQTEDRRKKVKVVTSREPVFPFYGRRGNIYESYKKKHLVSLDKTQQSRTTPTFYGYQGKGKVGVLNLELHFSFFATVDKKFQMGNMTLATLKKKFAKGRRSPKHVSPDM